MLIYTLNRHKLRKVRRREGRYSLRPNLIVNGPALLWQYYTQLVAVEQAFRLSRRRSLASYSDPFYTSNDVFGME
jgi:hypothetical protein